MKVKLFVLLGLLAVVLCCKRKQAEPPAPKPEYVDGKEIYANAKTLTVDTAQITFEVIPVADSHYKRIIQREAKEYYTRNGMKTRWLFSHKPSRLFTEYMAVLDSVSNYGLNPKTYRQHTLKKAVDSLYTNEKSDEEKVALDRQITASFLLFTKHLTSGRLARSYYGTHIWLKPKPKNNPNILLGIGDDDALATVVGALHPKTAQYKQLLAKYKTLKAIPDESVEIVYMEEPKLFRYGYTDPVVLKVRRNLEQRGYKAEPEIDDMEVDSTLIRTLIRFQRDKGLLANGRLTDATIRRMNMTASFKKDIIWLNIERMRAFNNHLGDDYLIVNIPDYKLCIYHKDSVIGQMRIMVGKAETPTPIFTDSIRFVEFRPTWSVPQSIIHKEMIPEMISKEDPERYKKRGYSLFENGKKIEPNQVNWADPNIRKRSFYFIEEPSERNSLGLVKFALNNGMSIYLHDTPAKYLFARQDRALSHGCIRLEQPTQLARIILRNQGGNVKWTEDKIKEAMTNEKHNQYRITPKTKYMINVLYYTTEVNDRGEIELKNDIYGIDGEQLKELKRFGS
ncbi:L,D-transpeptidase family protein [Capnocytophaga haemolytica]